MLPFRHLVGLKGCLDSTLDLHNSRQTAASGTFCRLMKHSINTQQRKLTIAYGSVQNGVSCLIHSRTGNVAQGVSLVLVSGAG